MEDTPAEIVQRTPDVPVHVRTFLIADIRGYTTFTRERGDEAAAYLASTFAGITRDTVREHGGEVLELRGDEALAVFTSTRQALRAAVSLQMRYVSLAEETTGMGLPLPVGIGIDAGEAVPVEGGYRGAALNMAARLCSAARPGEILTTEAVSHLAGTVVGLEYAERRLRNVKGMDAPVRAVQVSNEELRSLLPRLPSHEKRVAPRDEDELGAQISSMVQEHLASVNEHLANQFSSLKHMPQMQPAIRFERKQPQPPPALPVPDPEPGGPLRFRLALLVVLVAVIVIGLAALWLHFH